MFKKLIIFCFDEIIRPCCILILGRRLTKSWIIYHKLDEKVEMWALIIVNKEYRLMDLCQGESFSGNPPQDTAYKHVLFKYSIS